MKIGLALLFSFISAVTYAQDRTMAASAEEMSVVDGVWISGGGKFLMDGRNPWFLYNTPDIRYCAQVNEADFGLSQARVETILREGIMFWQNEFVGSSAPGWVPPDTGLQNFVLEDCQPDTDVIFQFGVLSKAQETYLGNPREYVGVAVRTSYDQSNLRGKGFVYISPEQGPLALSAAHLVDKPWSTFEGIRLFYVLVHEIGHIFGLGHNNSIQVMAEDYPERMLLKSMIHDAKDLKIAATLIPGVFALREREAKGCSDVLLNTYRLVFGVPQTHECWLLRMTKDEFMVYSKEGEMSTLYQKVGKATYQNAISWTVQMPLQAYVTAEQDMFHPDQNLVPLFPFVHKSVYSGEYRSIDGAVIRGVMASIEPKGLVLAIVFDGVTIPDVFQPAL